MSADLALFVARLCRAEAHTALGYATLSLSVFSTSPQDIRRLLTTAATSFTARKGHGKSWKETDAGQFPTPFLQGLKQDMHRKGRGESCCILLLCFELKK
jgi:hypothetical protein